MNFFQENPQYLALLLVHLVIKAIIITIIWRNPNLLKSQKIFGLVGTMLSTLVGFVLLFVWKDAKAQEPYKSVDN